MMLQQLKFVHKIHVIIIEKTCNGINKILLGEFLQEVYAAQPVDTQINAKITTIGMNREGTLLPYCQDQSGRMSHHIHIPGIRSIHSRQTND